MQAVLIRLKSKIPNQNAENASATVKPNMLPPKRYAYTGKIKTRLARSATPVAIKLPEPSVISTVFKFFL